MNWREHFGIDPDLDAVQPGHNRGVKLLYVLMVVYAGVCLWNVVHP